MELTWKNLPIPDTASWAHDEYWTESTYSTLLTTFLENDAGTLALLAVSPAAAPNIHSDEWNTALLHALALSALPYLPPF